MKDFNDNNIVPDNNENNAGNQMNAYNGQQQANPYMGNQQQFTAEPAMMGYSPQQALARENDYKPLTGYQPQGSYPNYGGYGPEGSFPNQMNQQAGSYPESANYGNNDYYNQSGYQSQTWYDNTNRYQGQTGDNRNNGGILDYRQDRDNSGDYSLSGYYPQNPAPKEPEKKHTVQIVILFASFILISLCVIAIFLNLGPFKQSGGRETVSALMNDYIAAVNNSDVDAYMNLLLKAERTDAERKEVQKAFSKLAYTDGDMVITVGASKNYSDSKKQLVKDKLNDLSVMPVRVDSVQEVNATIRGTGYEQHVIFTVVESGGSFFIDDIVEK